MIRVIIFISLFIKAILSVDGDLNLNENLSNESIVNPTNDGYYLDSLNEVGFGAGWVLRYCFFTFIVQFAFELKLLHNVSDSPSDSWLVAC